MNHYRWNMLNNINDMVFVVDVKSKQVILKNNVFDELVGSVMRETGATLADLVPKKEGCPDLLSGVLAHFAKGDGTPFVDTFPREIMNRTIMVEVISDYFDEAKNEVYFILKGYQSILQFIRYKNSIAKIAANIVVFALDKTLTLYATSALFDKTFGTPEVSFAAQFEGSFAGALPEHTRAETLQAFTENIMNTGEYSRVIELSMDKGTTHYVVATANRIDDLMSVPMVCMTLQIIDESMKAYYKLQKEHEVYVTTAGFSSSVMFRIHLQQMTGEFYGQSTNLFNLSGFKGNFVQEILSRGLIHPDDIDIFKAMMIDMQQGIEKVVRMRICSLNGRKDWFILEYKITYDVEGKPLQALGKITNVQLHEELQAKATLDLLTECLNKGTFEGNCTNLLNDRRGAHTHAFFIIDIDNFKGINDNLGHFFGDIVLKEVAVKLKRIFRESDYIARIGGDEFAVLMREIKGSEIVMSKANELVKALDITYSVEGVTYAISASVGIALYPSQADNYQDIYKRADIALYHAKNTGKNAHKLYDESLMQGTMVNTTPFDVANRAYSYFFDQQVAMDTFNLLFEATNSHDAVSLVMRHLGERFDVDRCYVFEAVSDDCLLYNNTYEWCKEGVEPEIDNLQDVPYEQFNEVFAQANAEGVFYCNDVSTLPTPCAREILMSQGIISMLHTYVKYGGRVKYALGFDDCTTKRIWKPSEISTLMYASKIIAQYLRYDEAIKRATKALEGHESKDHASES